MADLFSKSVREMTLDEVESLHAERVPENIRLEYKEKLPDDTTDFRETVAKELSAFANSYGGYLIVGISTDAKGNPVAMNGVPETNNLAQRIVSVGYEQIFPPVIPVISNPIKLSNGNFVHVIYQDLSLEAPHFLNRRRGAYVRTSEFSQTFTPELATWEELQLLQNRRNLALQQRNLLNERGNTRRKLFLGFSSIETPVMVQIAIGPAFPVRRLVELDKLKWAMESARFWLSSASAKWQYPAGDQIILHDCHAFSKSADYYIEGTAWGTAYSAEIIRSGSRETSPVRLEKILEAVFKHVKFGARFLKSCGFNGLININASLVNGQKKNFRCGDYDQVDVRCREPGEIAYELNEALHVLMRDYRPTCLEIFRSFAFATGWQGVFSQNDDVLIKSGLKEEEDFFSDLPK